MVMPVWRRPKAVALGNLELPTKSVSHGPSFYQLIDARGAPLAHTKYLTAFLCHRATPKDGLTHHTCDLIQRHTQYYYYFFFDMG